MTHVNNPVQSDSFDISDRFRRAVNYFWAARHTQQQKQIQSGSVDAGTRGAVTGGTQMAEMETLAADILLQAGLDRAHVRTRTALEMPGYYRPEKKWDLLVVAEGSLLCAAEFKSQVGPSFGNNFNNRVEEAVGSATDLWTAYREGRLGGKEAPRPLLAYFFLLEDCPKVHRPVRASEPYFGVDPAFKSASYAKRYELLCRRLRLERLYDATCLTLSVRPDKNPNGAPIVAPTHPASDLAFRQFAAELEAAAYRFLRGR